MIMISFAIKGLWFLGFELFGIMQVVPKHSIICSFATHNTLATFDNLMGRDFHGPNYCILCGENGELASHLFFACMCSGDVLLAIKACIKLMHTSYNLKQTFWLLRRHYKKDKWRNKLVCCVISATVYYKWLERNVKLFDNKFSSPYSLLRKSNLLPRFDCCISQMVEWRLLD